MEWVQLKVRVPAERLDETAAVMGLIDPALQIEDYTDIEDGVNAMYGELIDESLMAADRSRAAVSLYIRDPLLLHDSQMFIRERLSALGIPFELELDSVHEEDWSNAWRKYYQPIKTGPRLTIVPAWQEYEAAENEVVVLMEPGMAFGTGTHETTRLCASLIEAYMPVGGRCLDIGTGSGILAIAESKLGAAEVYACDIDENAVAVAKRNCIDNGVTNVICETADLLSGKAIGEGLYDFASANIVTDILIRLAPQLKNYLKIGADIVMSGIIEERGDEVQRAMSETGYLLADAVSENGWKGFVFKRVK
jgi:ribosomal protein L11 methyltransferase